MTLKISAELQAIPLVPAEKSPGTLGWSLSGLRFRAVLDLTGRGMRPTKAWQRGCHIPNRILPTTL